MEGSNSPRDMLLLNGHAEGAAHHLGLTNGGASGSNSLPAGNVKTDHFNGDDLSSSSFMSIPQFYAGRSVFITGGTGFMGKLITRILYITCSSTYKYLENDNLISESRTKWINAQT